MSQQHIEGRAAKPDCDRYSEVYEVEAAKSCIRKTAIYFVLAQTPLETRNLRTIMSVTREKMLLLYLHNDGDEFSRTFCKSLAQTAIKTALKKFCILGWDVGETEYHNALVKVLNDNDLPSCVCLVESKASAAICLQIVDGSAVVVSLLIGEMSENEILAGLERTQKPISESAPRNSGTSEMDAAKSCIAKTSRFGLVVKFETKELKQLQYESLTSRKTLLLFLYNELDEFSKTICENLADRTYRNILENFYFLGWDIGESKYHNALSNTLSSCNLHSLVPLVQSKFSAAICLRNIDQTLVDVCCLNGDVSDSEIFKKLEELDSSASEIDVATSCVRKLAHYLIASRIKFETRALEEVLAETCFAPLDHRKTLMLYLHNEEDNFSKIFCSNLKTMKTKAILEHFCILGWDISNSHYHEALKQTLTSYKLELVCSFVETKTSALMCLQNIDGCIMPAYCLTGTMSDSKLLEELTEIYNLPKQQIKLKEDSEDNDINSRRYQQIMADMLGDRDYDLIDFDQKEVLERKIGFALYGPPVDDTGKYSTDEVKKIKKLCDVIMTQSNQVTQYKDEVKISIIYNCVEPLNKEKLKKKEKNKDYNPNTDLMPIPLFILRKCQECPQGRDPCRIFIDDTGRVYSTWQDYKENNKLHKCIMVLPANGRYQVDENEKVLLERLPSPACDPAQLALEVTDVANTGVGLATGGVLLAAAFTPVMPAVLITAAVAGAATGVYGIVRSAINLADKSKHKESLSFLDSGARGAYLNIVAGSLGFVGMGANAVVAQLASRGANIGKGAIYTVNTLNVANLSASGASVINSGVDVVKQWIYEDQKPSLLTLVQLSSSLLFFGHAIYNFKSAGNIIEESQARTMKQYQDSLRSNRHRKMFNKMMKETIRQNDGNVNAGRAEVIKTISNIQNKDEVFASLVRNNKQMNKNGVRFSASNGQIQLNGQNIDMGTFISMNKNEANMFLGKLPMKPNVTQAEVKLMKQVYTVNNFVNRIDKTDLNRFLNYSAVMIGFLRKDVQSQIIFALDLLTSKITSYFENILKGLFPDNYSMYIKLLKMVLQFFADKARAALETQCKTNQNHEDANEEINYQKVFENVVRACFYKGQMKEKAVKELINYFNTWIAKKLYQKEEENERKIKNEEHSKRFPTKSVKCDVCGGNYYVKIR